MKIKWTENLITCYSEWVAYLLCDSKFHFSLISFLFKELQFALRFLMRCMCVGDLGERW